MINTDFNLNDCNFVVVNENGDYIDFGKPCSYRCQFDYGTKVNVNFAFPIDHMVTDAVDLIIRNPLNSRNHYFVTCMPHADKVILHDPAVVVYWNDGTKTVAKAQNERYDPEKGLAMCFVKKMLDMNGMTLTVFNKLLKEADAK